MQLLLLLNHIYNKLMQYDLEINEKKSFLVAFIHDLKNKKLKIDGRKLFMPNGNKLTNNIEVWRYLNVQQFKKELIEIISTTQEMLYKIKDTTNAAAKAFYT